MENSQFNLRESRDPRQFTEFLSKHGMILPADSDLSPLREPVRIGEKTVPNRICIQPLEGFDSGDDGSPTDLVRRRYGRFAESGAGLVWFESAAVAQDGRSNPHQMMLSSEKLPAFRSLLEEMDRICLLKNGYRQYKVLQLTHSGRMSRGDDRTSKPVAARRRETDTDGSIVAADERIHRLIGETVEHAVMARDAGFDAVDIKACHGYFLSEMLGAFEREGEFGGSFENRTKALLAIIGEVKKRTGDSLALTVRLNAYDSGPSPKGWGLRSEGDTLVFDPEEPVRLCTILRDMGVEIIDISASQPNQSLFGGPFDGDVQPFAGTYDLLSAVREIRRQVPGVRFVCTGLSALRQFGPAVGAGGIRDGWFDFAGFGRQALAYPGFAQAALHGETPDPGKCCTLCNSCFRLMNPGFCPAGCPVRDPDPYMALYRENVLGKNKKRAGCR